MKNTNLNFVQKILKYVKENHKCLRMRQRQRAQPNLSTQINVGGFMRSVSAFYELALNSGGLGLGSIIELPYIF